MMPSCVIIHIVFILRTKKNPKMNRENETETEIKNWETEKQKLSPIWMVERMGGSRSKIQR